MKKLTLLLTTAGILSYSYGAFANTNVSTANVQQEIKSLQTQLAALEKKVNTDKKAQQVDAASSSSQASNLASPSLAASIQAPEVVIPSSTVLVANYVGVQPRYDGSNLIINNPGVNNDVALLKLRQAEIQAYEKSGQTYTATPKLIFSGEVEGTSNYSSAYTNTPAGTNFDLTDAELDTFIEGNRWVSGFLTFAYNNGNDGEANRVNNSEVQLGQGYVTIGDLTTLPFYASAGQMYVPFGRYTSYMVSSPSSKTLGRIQTRAINLGYHSSNSAVSPFAAIYGYQGATELDGSLASTNDIEGYGANLGLNVVKGDYSSTLGVSYTSNIAESSGLQGSGAAGSGFAQSSSSENLVSRVPGVDINGLATYRDYSLLAEYVSATKKFNPNDLSYNNQGAQPQAADIEAAYSFVYGHPSYVAAAYGQSWQALSLGVPKKNFGLVYSTAIWQNTALSVEVMHNIGYSGNSSAQLDNQSVTQDTVGQNYNSVALRFDLFF